MTTVEDLLGPAQSPAKRIAELERKLLAMTVLLHRYSNVGARRTVYTLVIRVYHKPKHGSYEVAESFVLGGNFETLTLRQMQVYLGSDAFRDRWLHLTHMFCGDRIDSMYEQSLLKWEGRDVVHHCSEGHWKLYMQLFSRNETLVTETHWVDDNDT